MTIYDIISRAEALARENKLASVTPERVGNLIGDTLKYINSYQLLASSPLMHKTYASVSAMQADASPVSDLTGNALKKGQLVVIVPADQSDATAGDVYRYDGPSGNTSAWTFIAKIGGVPADAELNATSTNPVQNQAVTAKLTELESKVIQVVVAEGYDNLTVGTYYTTNYEAIYYYVSNDPLDVKKVLSPSVVDERYIRVDSVFLIGMHKYTWNGNKLIRLVNEDDFELLSNKVNQKATIISNGGFSSTSSVAASDIASCISNYKLYSKTNAPYILLQTGWKSSSPNSCLFYIEPLGTSEHEGLVYFSLSVSSKPEGVKHIVLKDDNIVVEMDFDWDKFHELFPSDYYRGNQTYPLIVYPIGNYSEYINISRIETDEAVGLGFDRNSIVTNENNQKILQCISQYLIVEKEERKHQYILLQTGWKETSPNSCLFYIKDVDENKTINATEYVSEKPTGKKKHCLNIGNVQIQLVMDWDKFHTLFPSDYYRGNQTYPLIVYPTTIESPKVIEEIDKLKKNIVLGDTITINEGGTILLVGASFASATNGWFELACSKLGIVGINRAIGGQRITNNVVARMMDANTTMPHGSLFYIGNEDVFGKVEAFVMMMTHDDNVYLEEDAYIENTIELYKSKGADNLTPSEAFDYCIKQYRQWCAEYTTNQERTSGDNSIQDVLGTKECQILICSNWHTGRTTYNRSSRELARRYNLPYCAFDLNLSIGECMIETTINTDANQEPTKGVHHPSVLYAHYDSFYNGKWAGKTEVIDGITYGWHPQTKSTSFEGYGTIKEADGYYYPKIQRMMAGCFKLCISVLD